MENRIKKCIDEEYYYLDLNNIENQQIPEDILNKITLLDWSNSNLNIILNLNYKNLIILNIENNNISGTLTFMYLEELNCAFNKIDEIHSNTILRLICNDNNINNINNLPLINYIDITNNPIENINYFQSLKHIVCSTKYISNKYIISCCNKMEDYYIIKIDE